MVHKKTHIHTIILALLCIGIFTSHVLYVGKSRQYPQWDEHHYLSEAVAFYDIIKSGSPLWYQKMLAAVSYRQPVYALLITALLLVFGTAHTYAVALLLNGLLYVSTILCIYFLARAFIDKTASLMAAIIFTCYGNSLFFLHFTYSETALSAFVTALVFFLWKTDYFTKPKETFWFALLFGLTNLVKWSAPAFVVLPLGFVGIGAIIRAVKHPKERSAIAGNILLAGVVGIVIPVLIYYLPNWEPFIAYVQRNQTDGPAWVTAYRFPDMVNTLSVHSLVYYSNILSQNTVYFFVLFALGFLISLRFIKKYAYILLAFASQYGFLTLFTVWKEDRYAVSMYPFMALLSAVAFQHIHNKYTKFVFITITVIFALLNFFGASWAVGPMGKRGLTDIVLPAFIKHPRRIYLTPLVWPPNVEFVNAHLLFDIIQKNPTQYRPAKVLQLFTYEPWDNAVMSIMSYEKRGIIKISNDPDTISESDYVLTKNEELPKSRYQFLGVIIVPIDSSRVYVYRTNL